MNLRGDNQPLWERYQDRLQALSDLQYSFDLERRSEYTAEAGWNVDHYETELPSEPAGEPIANGSWENACDVLKNYEFPDPGILTGIYIPDNPLDNRVMLLKARFLIFTFWFGVRINQIIDEASRATANGSARVWGYSYATLDGHFEMGEITFEIYKYLESGKVEFHINAYSKTGHISNIFYRIGFALFGRRLQIRFSEQSLKRMQRLVTERTSKMP